MKVTDWSRTTRKMIAYSKTLRDDPDGWKQIEQKFGRDAVNSVAWAFHYRRRMRIEQRGQIMYGSRSYPLMSGVP